MCVALLCKYNSCLLCTLADLALTALYCCYVVGRLGHNFGRIHLALVHVAGFGRHFRNADGVSSSAVQHWRHMSTCEPGFDS